MTDAEQKDSWMDDVARGIFPLRHFMYCYVHPENVKVLLVGIRLNAAIGHGGTVRFDCPMLGRTWLDEDFRPDIARELYANVGLKRDERLETYKLCPYSLVVAGIPFVTCHANDMTLDLDGAYWLPPVDTTWKRELRAA